MPQEVGARAAEMEVAAAKIAGELAEYKAESKELHNQEHTIRRLEEKARSLETQLEDKVPPPCTCCPALIQFRSPADYTSSAAPTGLLCSFPDTLQQVGKICHL